MTILVILVLIGSLTFPGFVFAGELSNQFTVSLWVNPTTSIASKALAVKNTEIRLVTDGSGNPACQIYTSSAWATAVTSSTALTLNSWSHVACTYDKANIRVYINGVQTGSGAQTNTVDDNATNFLVGQDDSTTYGNFIGTIDQFTVYNYARTAKQVVEDMNAGEPPGGRLGALGYWKFDEGADNKCSGGTNDVCNSGSGGTALDGAQSGMSVPATATSGWTNSGKFGKGLIFNGSTNWVDLGTDVSLKPTTSLTVSAWVNRSGAMANFSGIVSSVKDNSGNGGYILTGTSTNKIRFYIDNNGSGNWSYAESNAAINQSQWYSLIGTWDGSTVRLYINGVLQSTTASATSLAYASSTNINHAIGRYVSAYFLGSIDEPKIYNYALTADEVKTEYNRGSSLALGSLGNLSTLSNQASGQEYCVPGDTTSCASPKGRWDFEEGSGATAFDTSGNGYNGTITALTYTAGKIGKGLNYSGGSDNAVGSISSISGIKTVSFWVNPASTTANLIDLQTTPGTINISASSGTITANGFTSPIYYVNGVATTSPTLTAKIWNHIEITTTTAITGSAVRFGKILTTAMTGKLDAVRFYDYVRTPAQVAYDYNKGAPIGWWKMDECQGGTINDSSGKGNIGTINLGTTGTQRTAYGNGTCAVNPSPSQTPWYSGATGKRNSSLNFDGTDDYVDMGDSSTNNIWSKINNQFTISTWAKNTQNGDQLSASQFIVAKDPGSTSANRLFYIGIASSLDKFYGTIDNSNGTVLCEVTGKSIPQANTWYHVLVTYDSSVGCNLYVNGVLNNSSTTKPTITTNNGYSTVVGSFGNGGTYTWSGQIDDVRIYNYALTPLQVKMIMNEGATRFGPATGSP